MADVYQISLVSLSAVETKLQESLWDVMQPSYFANSPKNGITAFNAITVIFSEQFRLICFRCFFPCSENAFF